MLAGWNARFALFEGGIRDFKEKWGRDSGLKVCMECGMWDAGCGVQKCGMRNVGYWMTGLKNVRYMGTHEHHGSVI